MKSIFLVLITCSVAFAAEPAAKHDPAEELLDVMHSEDLMVDSSLGAFDGFTKQMAEKGVPAEGIKEIRDEARLMYDRIFRGPKMRKLMIDLYNKHFTPEEIVELTEFYRTPLGQKTLANMPAIMADSVKNAMPMVQKEMQAFKKKVADIRQKYQKTEEDAGE